MESKPCIKCGEIKPLNEFRDERRNTCTPCRLAGMRAYYHKNPARQQARAKAWRQKRIAEDPGAYKARCRAANLKYMYDLTDDQRQAMAEAQAGKCAIQACSRLLGPRSRTHTDHCHKTGKLRALLCPRCNTGLGKFEDDPVLLRQAADYLEKHQKQEIT